MSSDEDSPNLIGIDLGTTRSVAAKVDRFGRPQTLLNAEGDLATPSAVLFEDGRIIIGKEAIRAIPGSANSVAQFAKRELGNPTFSMSFEGVSYPPEMIQSFILGKVRRDAERALGTPVQAAVITVPAFFDEGKRRATIDAGLLAGIEVKAIINEPTAAALAFGAANGLLDRQGAFKKPQRILVYDLGGGTFDVSLLRIKGHDVEVVAVDGNSRLGGIDWDRCIVKWLGEQFEATGKVSPDELEAAAPVLMREAEELKHALSARTSVKARCRVGDVSLHCELSREEFEDITVHLLDRTRFTVRKILADRQTAWEEVDRVLLVGGSTRMPQVAEMLQNDSDTIVDHSLSPDEAVAHGAAVYAHLVVGRPKKVDEAPQPEINVADVNAHSLGVIGIERSTQRRVRHVMIEKNTRLPARNSYRFKTLEADQPNVVVRVVEGGDKSGKHAIEIGKLVVDLPSKLPAGAPIDVTFRYDRDGLIEVEATDVTSGKQATIRIERSSGLSGEALDELRDKNREIFDALGLD